MSARQLDLFDPVRKAPAATPSRRRKAPTASVPKDPSKMGISEWWRVHWTLALEATEAAMRRAPREAPAELPEESREIWLAAYDRVPEQQKVVR